ncbi:BamA/TamA family outer membrane protein [Reichenbachiella versicolor]|uniref:BamA/TamA family outer membrane protein n=1 Tax=Reichenbachiella versicolor TaxID=1821036 RepID=UPI000D6E3CAD|nr:BamA/TamA family outer membrane protein [Reichenbachiella versicolor]
MKKVILILLLSIYWNKPLFAQDQYRDEQIHLGDTIVNTGWIKTIGIPIIFYTPETNLGFGGGAQFFLTQQNNKFNQRRSNILASGIYTLKKQVIVDIKPQIYLAEGEFFLDMVYQYKVFPNSFWGVGNNTPDDNREEFNSTSNIIKVAFLRRIPSSLNFGLEYHYEHHYITKVEEEGLLAPGNILGSNKAVISGLGAVFNFDSRDNTASTSNGHFLQMSAKYSSINFGATSGYNKFVTDLRTYRPITSNSTLAFQVYTENNYGEVPFQGMAWFGGGERGRGYFKGRFMDLKMFVLQAEYRLRFHPRWTAAGFALAGNVGPQTSEMINSVKSSYGGGIRYKLTKDEDIRIRLDFGFGQNGSNGIYFGVNEAF